MTKHITRMEIDDAEHYTPEQRQAIINAYPEHEREARTKGIPSLGSGRVFPISEDAILCDPIPMIESTVGMYGDLKRITGKTLEEIDGLAQIARRVEERRKRGLTTRRVTEPNGARGRTH